MLTILILNLTCLSTFSQTVYNKLEYNYDANGNRTSRTVQIVLNKNTGESPELSIPNNKIFGEVSCYPNPTNGVLTIKFDQSVTLGIICNYAIFNMEGKLVKKGELNGSTTTIDISTINDGMYLLNLNSNLGTRKIKITKLTN